MTAANPEELKRLLLVQEQDRGLDALTHQLATLPQRDELVAIDQHRSELEAVQTEIAGRRHELERDQRRLEDEVALIEDRIKTEDGKLYGGEVSGVKELQALQDEIAGLKARQTRVEDQVIGVMESAEPVDEELAQAARQGQELDAQQSAATAGLAEAEVTIDAEAAQLQELRNDTAAGINQDLLGAYQAIRSQPGRIGVAKLVGSTCHGCHLELAAMEVDRLRKLPADSLVHCEECGAILVR